MTGDNSGITPAAAGCLARTRPAPLRITAPDEQEHADRHRRLWLQYALQTPQPAPRSQLPPEEPHAPHRMP